MRIAAWLFAAAAAATLSGCGLLSSFSSDDEASVEAAQAASDVRTADANEPQAGEGVRAPREVFVGEWTAPVPGQPGRSQGYAFRADGTASSIGMATLAAKRWAVNGEYLTIWGDSSGNGMTIPFEMQYLVLEATPETLHIRQGAYEARFTKRR